MQGGRNALRQDGAIEFDEARHQAGPGQTLFYGPYIALEPGVYLLTFSGSLDGALMLDFAHDGGRSFRELEVESFARPVCLVVTEPLGDFEVRGRKSPSLRSLRLEGVEVERVYAEPVR